MGSPDNGTGDIQVAHEKETAPGTSNAPRKDASDVTSDAGPDDVVYPTDEEMQTLRRVHGKISWLIYSIGIVELVERFAYYGTTAVCTSHIHTPRDPS